MMRPARYPHWHLFRPLMDDGVPLNLAVPGAPTTRLFFEPPDRIGLHVAAPEGMEVPADLPTAIRAVQVLEGGARYLEVSSTDSGVFPQVYFLLTFLADEVQLEGIPPTTALVSALDAFRRLVRVEPVLSGAAQLGLFGELWLLERLLRTLGTPGLEAWVGPLGQPHDFRLGEIDVEVKTTAGERRSHVISSLTQLLPSAGRPLYVLSLGFQPAPAATSASTLREVIRRVHDLVASSPPAVVRFERLLAFAGWCDGIDEEELVHFIPRLPPRVVPVDSHCPRIIPPMLESGLGSATAARVSEVQYRVDLDGLGQATSSSVLARFLEITE